MKRHDFILLLGGAVAAPVLWPLTARAEPRDNMRRIGILHTTNPERSGAPHFLTALSKRGWIEGHNLRVESRYAGGDADIRNKLAAELVKLAPDAILAGGSGATAALLQLTRTVPIVFVQVGDPVEAGFVASLAHPGGNATGFTNFEISVSAKWLELLKQIDTSVTRIAVIRDPGVTNGIAQFEAIRAAAPALGVQLHPVDARDKDEIARRLTELARAPNTGVIVTGSALAGFHSELIIGLAARHRLPAIYPERGWVESGGLMSYAPDRFENYRRAADYADRILRGEKPADLPVQAPVTYELVVNLKTAKTLGLEIPPSVLARADEVIE